MNPRVALVLGIIGYVSFLFTAGMTDNLPGMIFSLILMSIPIYAMEVPQE